MAETTQPPTAAKKADQLIRHFESQGRDVVAVTIKGAEIRLDFARPKAATIDPVDLITMGE